MLDPEVIKGTERIYVGGLIVFILGVTGLTSIILVVCSGTSVVFAQNATNETKSTRPLGVQSAINDTGQFLGNVSETVAENPIVTNVTGETQEFFSDKSK